MDSFVHDLSVLLSMCMRFATQQTVLDSLVANRSIVERFYQPDGSDEVSSSGGMSEVLVLAEIQRTVSDSHVDEVVVTTQLVEIIDKNVLSCFVISRKASKPLAAAADPQQPPQTDLAPPSPATDRSAAGFPSHESPMTVKDCHIHSVAVGNTAWDDLHQLLGSVYDPLCSNRELHLRSQVGDLMSAIRSRSSLQEFKAVRYVHSDLLKLAREMPHADAKQIQEHLAHEHKNSINQFRGEVFDLCMQGIAIVRVDIHRKEVTSFREELAYWQGVQHWLRDVQEQLREREWMIAVAIVAHRLGFSDKEVIDKASLVREYLSYLQEIPYQEILTAESEAQLKTAANNLFNPISQRTKYPAKRNTRLVDVLTQELCDRTVEVFSKRNVFSLPHEELLGSFGPLIVTLQEVKNQRDATLDLVARQAAGGGIVRRGHEALDTLLTRVRQLQDVLSQCHLDYAELRKVFRGPEHKAAYDRVDAAFRQLAATVRGLVFDTVARDAQSKFEEALATYDKQLQDVDEHFAQLARLRLLAATGVHDMFRQHSQYHRIRRSKIRAVVRQFQEPLLELINAGLKEAQDRYCDDTSAPAAIRVSIASGGVSEVVARILWAKGIEQNIAQLLAKRDAIFDYGWHQLLNLQTPQQYKWKLNETLAHFMGLTLNDITGGKQVADLELHGTALSLAYLELVYVDDAPLWSAEAAVKIAEKYVKSTDPSALTAAKASLKQLVVRGKDAAQDQATSARSCQAVIAKSIKENLKAWDRAVAIAKSSVDIAQNDQTFIIRGPVVCVVESNMRLRLVCNFPQELSMMQRDLQRLRNAGLFSRDNTVTAMDNIKFIENNANVIGWSRNISQMLATFYEVMDSDVDHNLPLLLKEKYEKVLMHFSSGAGTRWMHRLEVEDFSTKLATLLEAFCTAAEDVRAVTSTVEEKLSDFADEPHSPDAIRLKMQELRSLCNSLSMKCGEAGGQWIRRLEPRVDAIIVQHVEELIRQWVTEFRGLAEDSRYLDEAAATEVFGLKPKRLRMRVLRAEVRLESSAADWRRHWYGEFNRSLSWLSDVRPLLFSAGGSGSMASDTRRTSLRRIVDLVSPAVLQEPFEAIEHVIREAITVERQWCESLLLVNLDLTAVQQSFGTDLLSWNTKLTSFRDFSVKQMDSTLPSKLLGGIVILAEDAQKELGRRYSQMSNHLEVKFREVLELQLDQSLKSIVRDKDTIEARNVQGSLRAALRFLCDLPQITSAVKGYETIINTFGKCEATLRKTNFKFPSTWIYVSRIAGDFRLLNVCIANKTEALSAQQPHLHQLVVDDTKRLLERVSAMDNKYKSLKLEEGGLGLIETLDVVNKYHRDATECKEEAVALIEAQIALGNQPSNTVALDMLLDSVTKLKSVLDSLSVIQVEIVRLGKQRFAEVDPEKLQTELHALEAKLRNFHPSMRNTPTYTDFSIKLSNLLRCHRIIQDLRSDAMSQKQAERHWAHLKAQLGKSWNIPSLTLQDVWDIDLLSQRNHKLIQAVCDAAKGERHLEEQIFRISTYWETSLLSLSNYHGKVCLVKGWEALFEVLNDHLGSLAAMKLSPFYKAAQIEPNAKDQDEKLNCIRQVLELLLEVQRPWVYLEGIFATSTEIRHQLPNETAQFEKTTRDFLLIMPKPNKADQHVKVLQFTSQDKLLTNLEKIHRELSMVQRALGEFLETQRAKFPRFYFVGDDDLLDVIGNGKLAVHVAKHLKKMFCGISSLDVDKENGTVISAMGSPEFEVVPFVTPLDMDGVPVNEWLAMVESSMVTALRESIVSSCKSIPSSDNTTAFATWISQYPSQIVCLATQIAWVSSMEKALATSSVAHVEDGMSLLLQQLAKNVLSADLAVTNRSKSEQVITVAVYQRDVARLLKSVTPALTPQSFEWLAVMRPYLSTSADPKGSSSGSVVCKMADASFNYSFEYLGMQERLVQTALTDKCYLTLTQALHTRLGGSPSGPAGTGKTETVKALGMQLGRFVLVFCCDDTFDFKSMGRILTGLCQVGAWGCFDEFNRLEERILSAVSQQIQRIQEGLRREAKEILLSQSVRLHPNVGVFITMNPGYAGRSNLPDNLKQLFRSVAMTSPDRENIAEVMLFAQGFRTAETLSKKIVPLFRLCKDQLSQQSHYDFGLRALKSVLISAGALKRSAAAIGDGVLSSDDETRLMMQSLTETIVPKLVADDVELFYPLLGDVFPGYQALEIPLAELTESIRKVAAGAHYTLSPLWISKMLQLHKILNVNHGVMLVGPSGSGKTASWTTLLKALADVEDTDGQAYIIDPKAMTKTELYGVLDTTTREWKDGVFTATLRRIIDNVKGDDQSKKRHWIIFDGDVDPEWVENLNSLLDDNKLLTLPNGERLNLPQNVRIMFEVQDLRYATPATVSRCGMVWFSDDTVSTRHLLERHMKEFRSRPYTASDTPPLSFAERRSQVSSKQKMADSASLLGNADADLLAMQLVVAEAATSYFEPGGFVEASLHTFEARYAKSGIMDYNRCQSIRCIFTLFSHTALVLSERQEQGKAVPDAPVLKELVRRRLIFSILWGLASELSNAKRSEFAEELKADIPKSTGGSLLDFEVSWEDGSWSEWRKRVGKTDVPPGKVGTNDIVIQTVDTTRHEEVISAWLRTGRPVILCGPPGSGKTMSLTAVLRSTSIYDAVFLNFSSTTSPETIIKSIEQYCTVKNTMQGLVASPTSGKKLIIFCDEINLPSADKYGTQRVVQFMRQLTERGGYFRSKDNVWLTLQKVQFVGACNPPTDPGRFPLTHRFLRWAPVLFVDFPSYESLSAIYETYCRAVLYANAKLRVAAPNLAGAMVDVYRESQARFNAEQQPHYVYSPRELSRWSRAIFEGIHSLEDMERRTMDAEQLVRLAAHEGLRIFRDRLVDESEARWTDECIDRCFSAKFPGLKPSALERPILYSTIRSHGYCGSSRDELRKVIQERLRSFSEEEMDTQLVVFDSVIDHVTRIHRVLCQPLGHMLLVGASGVGKTVLSRFVSWMLNLSVFQVKAHRKYTLLDFEEDLRSVMRRAGCKREKICFIFDESNIMDSNFLEYMNALLASGEVPGLFDGDEWPKLMQNIREGITNMPDKSAEFVDVTNESELYKWFISNIQLFLHVVFTMNPDSGDFKNRSATSPALFNRCTIDWFGNWSSETILQVARERTARVDVMFACHERFAEKDDAHTALASCIANMHTRLCTLNEGWRLRNSNRGTFITPRHLLDFIDHFHGLYQEKRTAVEDLQRHLYSGLSKLQETSKEVDRQQQGLRSKEAELDVSSKKAQQMLDNILQESELAKKRKADATELKTFLEAEGDRIRTESASMELQLAEAEPALKEAEAALNTIKPEYLREIRAYTTPPIMVKKVLEAVVTLLGEKRASDWEVIKNYTRRDDFVSQIKSFKPSGVSEEAKERIKKHFLSDESFTYENAQRGSKAAGPMQKWVMAMTKFADVFASVAPLRNQIEKLSAERAVKQQGLEQAQKDIAANEETITKLKEDYQVTTERCSQIRSEIAAVAGRCQRAKSLMENLVSERARWEEQSAAFKSQTSSLVGDCVLAAGFLAYIGYFDELNRRSSIVPEWMDLIDACRIDFRRDISVVEYLSRPEDRLEWAANKLPQDTLCMENAIILHRFRRFPIIIDPSGQAVAYLLAQKKAQKISKSSFSDPEFIKQLERAVRFGFPILVQDAENIDPVLNPLLNREIRRAGGRQLIRLGANDVDVSPLFTMYMSTRESNFQFSPDICGRVTMVNFTVTLSSLQSQCLHQLMETERPKIEKMRSDLLKIQGEYKLRLRLLEQKLLEAIAASEGAILENDDLIKTLEQLKKESGEIVEKMADSESTLQQITFVEGKYSPLANASSKLFFSLGALEELNPLYRFSLPFFLDLLSWALSHLPPKKTEEEDRIDLVARNLFVIAHRRVVRSLFQADQLGFGLRLAQVRCGMGDETGRQVRPSDWDLLFSVVDDATHFNASGAGTAGNSSFVPEGVTLSLSQIHALSALLAKPDFASLRESMEDRSAADQWVQFFTAADPVALVPESAFPPRMTRARRSFMVAVLTRCARRDAFVSASENFLHVFFDMLPSGEWIEDPAMTFYDPNPFDLSAVFLEMGPSVPMLLVSTAGHDASSHVESLAQTAGKQLLTVAMGSPEGFDDATSYVRQAMKQGLWVLLKNVHLASQFLSSLEKRLHTESLEGHVNESFRLFMTSEPSTKLPPSLVVAALVVVFEPAPGVKSSLLRTIGAIRPASLQNSPREMSRLYLAAAWLHAVITERLDFAPLGWSKRYEFSEADFRRVVGTIDSWVRMTHGKVQADGSVRLPLNIDPAQLPWKAICYLTTQTIYGGKVDSPVDQKLLDSFCEAMFQEKIFESAFSFVFGMTVNCDGYELRDFHAWIQKLPEHEPPQWVGLPASSTSMLMTQRGEKTTECLSLLQLVFTDDVDDDQLESSRRVSSSKSSAASAATSAISRGEAKLLRSLSEWQSMLSKVKLSAPLAAEGGKHNAASVASSALLLALTREHSVAASLLRCVSRDISDLLAIAGGKLKPTNHHRTLQAALLKDYAPLSWRKYAMPPGTTVHMWIADFCRRLFALNALLTSPLASLQSLPINLGLLFSPEAFLTATRQFAARQLSWPLEQLAAVVTMAHNEPNSALPNEFVFTGISTRGGILSPVLPELVAVDSAQSARLPALHWAWRKTSEAASSNEAKIEVPLYMNFLRSTVLASVFVAVDKAAPRLSWYQSGLCLTAWEPIE
jgi:dynein heavy chain 1